MEELALRVTTFEYGVGELPAVEILVGGVPLPELVLGVEARYRPVGESVSWEDDLAPLPLDEVRGSAAWRSWPTEGTSADRLPLGTCGCGVFGCGGFTARVSVLDETLVWSELADVYWLQCARWEEELGYPEWRRAAAGALGPFRFHVDQYRAAIESVLGE